MQLSNQEKEEIKGYVDRGEPLPDKYRFSLFKEPREAELIWPGKTHDATNVVLPFQSIEQIDEPRAETAATGADLFTLDRTTGRQSGGWTNKLIWGDNKLVLSSIKNGPLRNFPDFIVKKSPKEIWIVETKGREDLDDPPKWQRLKDWVADASARGGGVKYRAMFVREEEWKKRPLKDFAEAQAAFEIA